MERSETINFRSQTLRAIARALRKGFLISERRACRLMEQPPRHEAPWPAVALDLMRSISFGIGAVLVTAAASWRHARSCKRECDPSDRFHNNKSWPAAAVQCRHQWRHRIYAAQQRTGGVRHGAGHRLRLFQRGLDEFSYRPARNRWPRVKSSIARCRSRRGGATRGRSGTTRSPSRARATSIF